MLQLEIEEKERRYKTNFSENYRQNLLDKYGRSSR